MKEEYIMIDLTLPPSVNEAYTGYPRRRKSDKYKKWERLNQYANTRWYEIIGDKWLVVTLSYFTPLFYKNWKKKKQDLDNWIKITLDMLWKIIPWFDDMKVKEINAKKVDSKKGLVKVMIKEI